MRGNQEGARQQVVVPSEWNRVTEQIIGCAIEVHRVLGVGLLERLYEEALEHELNLCGLRCRRQVAVHTAYKQKALSPHVLDMVVEDLVVVELKAIEKVADIHLATLVSYLRISQFPLGLLVNFHAPTIKNGLYRRLNPSSPMLLASQPALTAFPAQ
jgi:GxxExxY protein